MAGEKFEKKFEIGDTVIYCNDKKAFPRYGKIISNNLSDPLMVAVEWYNGDLDKVKEFNLSLYDPSLEIDFLKIKEAVIKATEHLESANELTRKHNKLLSDFYYDLGLETLLEQIDKAGWATSGMRC